MPPCLGRPPRIQNTSRSKAASAVAALSALVALLSLMKQHAADAADLLQPVRQAGKGRERGGHLGRRDAQEHAPRRWRRARSGCCAGRAASRCRRDRRTGRAARPRARGRRARCPRRTSRGRRASAPRRCRPSCGWRAAGARQMSRHQSSSSPTMAVLARPGHQPRLEGGVVLHGAVAVEVVGRDVEQDADASAPASASARSGRRTSRCTWTAAVRRRRERQHARADVAAHLRVPAGLAAGCARSAPWWWTCRWCR